MSLVIDPYRFASSGPPTFTNTIAAFWAGDPSWSNPGDGGAVSSWRDWSGQSRDITATGSAQPTYRSSVALLNNQPAVEFDGTSDYLLSSAFTAAGTTAHSWVGIVATGASATGATRVWGFATGTNVAATTYFDSSNRWSAYWHNAAAYKTVSPLAASSTAYALRTRFNGSNTNMFSVNGATHSPTTGGPPAAQAITSVGLSSVTNLWKGHIAYAALVDADVTADGNWSAFVSWVASTYGLTIA